MIDRARSRDGDETEAGPGLTAGAVLLALACLVSILFPPQSYPWGGAVTALALVSGMALARRRMPFGPVVVGVLLVAVNLAISLSPARTVSSLSHFILPAGAFALGSGLSGRMARIPLFGVTAGGVVLGILAVLGRAGLPSGPLASGGAYDRTVLAAVGGTLAVAVGAFLALRGLGVTRRFLVPGLLVVGAGTLVSGSIASFAAFTGLAAAGIPWTETTAWSRRRGIAILAAVVVSMVCVAALGPGGVLDDPGVSGSSLGEIAASCRGAARTSAWQPFAGTGLGSFGALHPGVREPGESLVSFVDNSWLQLVLEMGVPGIVLLGAAMLWLFSTALRTQDRVRRGMLAGVVGFAAGGLLAPLAYLPGIAVPTLALAGLAIARKTGRPDVESRGRMGGVGSAIVGILLLATLAVETCEALARHQLSQARSMIDAQEPIGRAESALAAAAWAPWDVRVQAEAAELVLTGEPSTPDLEELTRGPIRRLQRFDPESPTPWRFQGEIAERTNRLGDAWRSFRRAQARDSADALLASELGEIEKKLVSQGALVGEFEYGGDSSPATHRASDAWDTVLLLGYLAVALFVLGMRLKGVVTPPVSIALVLLLLIVPWGEGGRFAGAVLGRAILIGVAALAVVWPGSGRAGAIESMTRSWTTWRPALLFAGVACVATALAPDQGSAREGLMAVVSWVVLVLLSGLVAAERSDWARQVVVALACSAGLAGGWSLVQRILVFGGLNLQDAAAPLGLARDGRPAADFLHPGHLGTFLVAAGLALVGAALLSTPARRVGATVGLGSIALGLAQGARASIVALTAGVAIIAWLAGGKRIRLAIGSLAAVGVVVGGIAMVQRFSVEDPYAWSRIEIWRACAGAVQTRPLLGFGPGGFTAFVTSFSYPDPDPESFSRFDRYFLGPHSDVLSVFLAFGLVGGVAAVWGLGTMAKRAIDTAREARGADPWMVGAAAALAALAAHGLVDDFLRVRPAAAVAAAILLGALIGRGTGGTIRGPASQRASASTLRWVVSTVIVSAVLAGAIVPWWADSAANRGKPLFAARLYPTGVGYWIQAARAARGNPAERLARAVDHTGRATELLPEVELTWSEIAQVHEAALRGPLPTEDTLQVALQAWSRALDRSPHNAQARRARGRLRAFRGDLEGAGEDFRLAVEDEPNYLGARLDLARVLSQQGRSSEAADERTEVLRRLERLETVPPSGLYETALFSLTPDERAEIGAGR